jgi:YQGE family putative transporter
MLTAWRQLQLYFRQGVPEEKKLSPDAVISLVIHWFFQFGASMSGVFLNLYLWRLTESLWINGMYSIIVFVVTPIAFAIGGKLAKKKDRLFTFRLGIMLIALFYLMVVIFQEKVVQFFYLFALFNGFAASFYWTGYLTIMYDVSTDQNRIRYLAINMIVFTSAGLIGPALAGFIIVQFEGLSGYIITFALAFVMFLITTVISFRLKTVKTHHKAYYLRLMGLILSKNKRFHRALYGYVIFGTLQGIMIFLPNILLFQVLQQEDLVGYLGVLYSGLGIASSYFISRYAKESLIKTYILAAGCGLTAGSSLLLWDISIWTVIGFMIMHSVFFPLEGNAISSYYYRLIGQLPLKGQLRIESVVIREAYVNTGRVIAIFTLIVLAGDIYGGWLPWIIVAASLMQFQLIWLMDRDKSQ